MLRTLLFLLLFAGSAWCQDTSIARFKLSDEFDQRLTAYQISLKDEIYPELKQGWNLLGKATANIPPATATANAKSARLLFADLKGKLEVNRKQLTTMNPRLADEKTIWAAYDLHFQAMIREVEAVLRYCDYIIAKGNSKSPEMIRLSDAVLLAFRQRITSWQAVDELRQQDRS